MKLVISVDTGLPWGLPLSNMVSLKTEERTEISLSNVSELSKVIEDGLRGVLSEEQKKKQFKRYETLIKSIILRRLGLPNRKGYGPSAIVGEPDFLPFPFLKIGVDRGRAVCRIVRNFSSSESSNGFKTRLKQAGINSATALASILSLAGNSRQIFLEKHEQKFTENENYLDDLFKDKDFAERMLVNMPIATGFLVSKDHILTNYHTFSGLDSNAGNSNDLIAKLLKPDEKLKEYVCQFDYEHNVHGGIIEPIEYELDKFVVFDKALDYALVKLKRVPKLKESYQGELQRSRADLPKLSSAGDHFGIIPFKDNNIVAPPLFPKKPHLKDVKSIQSAEKEKFEQAIKKLLKHIVNQIDETLRNDSDVVPEIAYAIGRAVGFEFITDNADGRYQLKVMNPDSIDELPQSDVSALIIANISGSYYVRIFDDDGNRLLDESDVDFSSDQELLQMLQSALNGQLSDAAIENKLISKVMLALDFSHQANQRLSEEEVSEELYNVLEERAEFGEPVNVIQHPRGRRKEVVLSYGRVLESFKDFIMYDADSDFCSSGSPVFNQRWDLVALNRSTVPKQASEINESQVEDIFQNFEIVAQEGVLIRSIIADMQDKYNEWYGILSPNSDPLNPALLVLDELLAFLHASGNYKDNAPPILRDLPEEIIPNPDPITPIFLEGSYPLDNKNSLKEGIIGIVNDTRLNLRPIEIPLIEIDMDNNATGIVRSNHLK